MAVSRAMRRLLRLREMEEEARRAALESSLGDLRRLEEARAAARVREHSGRLLLAASVHSGEMTDRLAALEETHAAERHKEALEPRIRETEQCVVSRRRELLAKRLERRQVETLIEEAQTSEAAEEGRRTQRGLDDWFLGRGQRERDADSQQDRKTADSRPQAREDGEV